MKNELTDFLAELDFRWLQPGQRVPKGFGRFNATLKTLGIAFDKLNTRNPPINRQRRTALDAVCRIPRMATYSVGLIINQVVAQMPATQAYLNIGVWHGFSLLAGMAGNPAKSCIGIDNFSMWGGPRRAFLERFEKLKGPYHSFYELDYEAYLRHHHQQPLGFYFYDGDHRYEHQLRGLKLAEPYMAPGGVIMVDDTNWEEPRQATYDFMRQHEHYRVLLDQQTASDRVAYQQSAMHPTFWNGLMLIQKTT